MMMRLWCWDSWTTGPVHGPVLWLNPSQSSRGRYTDRDKWPALRRQQRRGIDLAPQPISIIIPPEFPRRPVYRAGRRRCRCVPRRPRRQRERERWRIALPGAGRPLADLRVVERGPVYWLMPPSNAGRSCRAARWMWPRQKQLNRVERPQVDRQATT